MARNTSATASASIFDSVAHTFRMARSSASRGTIEDRRSDGRLAPGRPLHELRPPSEKAHDLCVHRVDMIASLLELRRASAEVRDGERVGRRPPSVPRRRPARRRWRRAPARAPCAPRVRTGCRAQWPRTSAPRRTERSRSSARSPGNWAARKGRSSPLLRRSSPSRRRTSARGCAPSRDHGSPESERSPRNRCARRALGSGLAACGCAFAGQRTTRRGRSASARLSGPKSGCVPHHGIASPRTSANTASGRTLTLPTSSTICDGSRYFRRSRSARRMAGTGTATMTNVAPRTSSPTEVARCSGGSRRRVVRPVREAGISKKLSERSSEAPVAKQGHGVVCHGPAIYSAPAQVRTPFCGGILHPVGRSLARVVALTMCPAASACSPARGDCHAPVALTPVCPSGGCRGEDARSTPPAAGRAVFVPARGRRRARGCPRKSARTARCRPGAT